MSLVTADFRALRTTGFEALIAAAAVLTLFPLLWMVSVSLMGAGEATQFPPPLWPTHPTLDNYRMLFSHHRMGRYVLNSIAVSSLATLLSLGFNVTAGYAFAKLKFAGREKMFHALVTALVIPSQICMFPLFFELKGLGMINSYAGVVLPFLASLFGIFLVRQYALSLPDEMLQAARIDGANEWQVFWCICLPNLKPIMATLGVFTYLSAWNDFLWPLIVLSDDRLFTLPVAIASLAREHSQDMSLVMAGAVVTVVPVLVLFLVLQRHYIRGLLAGSVKG